MESGSPDSSSLLPIVMFKGQECNLKANHVILEPGRWLMLDQSEIIFGTLTIQ